MEQQEIVSQQAMPGQGVSENDDSGIKSVTIIRLEDGSFVVDEKRFNDADEALNYARGELVGDERAEEEAAFMSNYDSGGETQGNGKLVKKPGMMG